MSKRIWLVGVIASCGLLTASAWADSWMPPSIRAYQSQDGVWRLTVSPREITSPLAYFEDKVADRARAGGVAGSQQATASGKLERRQNGRWKVEWEKSLVNEVSPVAALVSNTGQVVTFDNWHSVGHGKDAIAIYHADGSLVRALALVDFLPDAYIRALPHSVSAMRWRGEPRISKDGLEVIVPIIVPDAGQEKSDDEGRAKHLEFHFALATAQLQPGVLDSKAWARALERARKVDQKVKDERAAFRHRFISPLAAPTNGEGREWHAYLAEAFFRIDADSDDTYPSTHVAPLSTDTKFDLLSGYFGDALIEETKADGAIMFASPSQDVLIQVLTKQAKRAKAGSLVNARIYVAVDEQHVDAARQALTHTGARFIQIDIDKPIPQRKARLALFLENDQQADE